MLTADWGTGKSYYIQNILMPFLGKHENGNHKCIVISLYGLNRIEDISKSIYLETRAKALNRATEKVVAGKLIAKTVVRGVSSFFGINLNASEKDLAKLYRSIDLSGKLVVFEDIERSEIDVLSFLGYVNNLVEQDNVKVLLVANEAEIIQYVPDEQPDLEKQKRAELINRMTDHKNRRYSPKTIKYFKTKEKTVSDTIQFCGDYPAAIKQIINNYDGKLNCFAGKETTQDVLNIMQMLQNYNLRSFTFACQKTADILDVIGAQGENFRKCIFYGIIAYSLRLKAGNETKWSGTENFSVELGLEKYPLFHFCYEYITSQILEPERAAVAETAYKSYCLYETNRFSDPAVSVICNYYLYTEKELVGAIESIRERLTEPENLSFYCYGSLVVCLLIVEKLFGFKIGDIVNNMVNNLKGRGDKIDVEAMFISALGDDDADLRQKFDDIKTNMLKSLRAQVSLFEGFDYKPEQSNEFEQYAMSNKYFCAYNRGFASKLDIPKMVDMISHSTPKQINDIRSAFHLVYRSTNIGEYLSEDRPYLEQLSSKISDESKSEGMDKVQKLQCKWFVDNLKEYIDKLS